MQTFKNLQDLVLDLIEIDDAITRTRAKDFINMAGRDIWFRYPWPERRKDAFTSTVAPYTTGTASVSQGSTTVTGSGTTWSTSYDGFKYAAGYDQPWYTATRDSDTQLTLDRALVEDSHAAGSSYVLYQDVLTFTQNCDSVTSVMVGDPLRGAVAQPVARVDLDGMAYLPGSTGVPAQYAMIEDSSIGRRRARIWPVPDDEYGIHYTYLSTWPELVHDADVPALHESRVDLIVLGAMRWAFLLAYETQKALAAQARFEQELKRTWGHTTRRHPAVHVMRKFDDSAGWRNSFQLPVVDA
jgi:hypothetical protein